MNHATRAEYGQPSRLDRLSILTSPIQSAADAGYLFRVPAAVLMVVLAGCAVIAGTAFAVLILDKVGGKAFLFGLSAFITGLGVASMMLYRAQAIFDIPSTDDQGAGFTIHRIFREYLVALAESSAIALGVLGFFGGIQGLFEARGLAGPLQGLRGWAILVGPVAGALMLALGHLLAAWTSVIFRIAETSSRTAEAAERD
jgi:hypothetical protein